MSNRTLLKCASACRTRAPSINCWMPRVSSMFFKHPFHLDRQSVRCVQRSICRIHLYGMWQSWATTMWHMSVLLLVRMTVWLFHPNVMHIRHTDETACQVSDHKIQKTHSSMNWHTYIELHKFAYGARR